jgi:hypothetical protein
VSLCVYECLCVFLYAVDVHLQGQIGSAICGFFDFRFGVL